MKRQLKKATTMLLTSIVIFATAVPIFANDANQADTVVYEESLSIESRLNVTKNVYLSDISWTAVVTDDAWLGGSVYVQNSSSNLSSIDFKIVRSNVAGTVYGPYTVAKGYTGTVSGIGAGGYTVYARASSQPGTYQIKVSDY